MILIINSEFFTKLLITHKQKHKKTLIVVRIKLYLFPRAKKSYAESNGNCMILLHAYDHTYSEKEIDLWSALLYNCRQDHLSSV